MSRALLLAVAPLLLLAGCGDQQPATVNEGALDAGLAQEAVVPGDVTAIDAATADDARMANDVPAPSFDENAAAPANEARPSRRSARPATREPEPAAEESEAEAEAEAVTNEA